MVFIENRNTDKVAVQYRTKNWAGYTFPGGHVKPGESFVDSAVREALEETGLAVRNLRGCGVIHWTNTKTHDRYLAFLYMTSDFSGEFLPESDEGKNCWMSVSELFAAPSENGLHEILYMFLHDEYSEAFGFWADDDWSIDVFK